MMISLMLTLHSNLVLFKYIFNLIPKSTGYLYIPIWFYSNCYTSQVYKQATYLYIPIWFYSNENNEPTEQTYVPSLHSNLVLFKSYYIYLKTPQYFPLHSNLVLFKFRGLAPLNSGMLTLHSNLVLFKFRRKSICLEQHHLYIPIWFYSNHIRHRNILNVS